MHAFRHLLAQRDIAVLICAMALLLKLLVPTGYMIGSDHGRLGIMICSGTAARPVAMAMPGMTHDMAAMHDTMSDRGKAGDHGKAEVPCAYAGLSAQMLGTVDPIILSAALSAVARMELLGSPRQAQRPVPYLRPPLRGPARHVDPPRLTPCGGLPHGVSCDDRPSHRQEGLFHMFRSLLPGVVALCAAVPSPAQVTPAPFTLPALPYAVDALDPAIDAQTMTIHHDRHHKAYVDALNKAVTADATLSGQPLEALVARAGTLAPGVRNNAGGHWNHGFFWKTMAPVARSGRPSSALAAAIDRQFGSLAAFKAAFKEAGTKRFGSGWVWLLVTPDGALAVTSTPNQDNPLMDVAEVKGTPILGNDVWEHAYYLKYQNRRADYLDGWWQVVNWQVVSDRYAAASKR